MTRIESKFKELRSKNKKAFIAFITAGYPDLLTTKKLVKELEARGADIIELGVPFSDPMADGPVIQEASQASLKKGTNLCKILDIVKELRKEVKLPICLMSYYNLLFRFGAEKFLRQARSSGVDGLIIPDLPAEEDKGFVHLAAKFGIDLIQFIAPTTTKERAAAIAKVAKGFIYYVSLTGVTGARKNLSPDLIKNLKIITRITDKPVCVGFGVSAAQHLRQVYRIADGAIVGSAIIKVIKENLKHKDLVKRVGRFVEGLVKKL